MTKLPVPKVINNFEDLFHATISITNNVMDKIEADLRELGPDEWLKRWGDEIKELKL